MLTQAQVDSVVNSVSQPDRCETEVMAELDSILCIMEEELAIYKKRAKELGDDDEMLDYYEFVSERFCDVTILRLRFIQKNERKRLRIARNRIYVKWLWVRLERQLAELGE
jgi:hypothetical protein